MLLEKLNYQISIREAQQGKQLKMGEITQIKEVIQQHGYIQTSKTIEEKTSDFAVDKMLTYACDKALNGFDLKGNSFKSQKEVSSTLQQVQTQMNQSNRVKNSLHKEVEKEKGIGIE